MAIYSLERAGEASRPIGGTPQPVPKDENDCEAAEKLLLTTWAYMIFYPKFSMERFAVYAEVNILLGEMLAGGWFE